MDDAILITITASDIPTLPAPTPRRALVALLLLCLAIFGRALAYAPVWDDTTLMQNPLLDGPLTDGLLATQHKQMDQSLGHLRGFRPAHESYRPLLFLSYKIDALLFARSTVAMHAHNLVTSLCCVLLCYLLLRRLFSSAGPAGPWWALAGAALFALHPLQVETACYISARGDSMATALALLSALAVCALGPASAGAPGFGAARRLLLLVASCLALFASLLAKEAYLLLPLAVLAWLLGEGRPARWQLAALGSQLLTAALYFKVRVLLVGQSNSSVDAAVLRQTLWELPGMALEYVRAFLLPVGLSVERLHRAAFAPAGWAVLVLVGALFVIGLRGRSRAAPLLRRIGAGYAWFLLLLAPSAVVVKLMGTLADRYAYLPLLGLILPLVSAAALLHEARPRWRRGLRVGALLLAVGALGQTALQVGVWRDDLTLTTHAVLVQPDSSMAQYRFGYQQALRGQWPAAIARFQEAVRLDPQNSRAQNNLAVALMQVDRFAEAEQAAKDALRSSDGGNFQAWHNLALLRSRRGETQKACAALGHALAINPAYGAALSLRAQLCQQRAPAGAGR